MYYETRMMRQRIVGRYYLLSFVLIAQCTVSYLRRGKKRSIEPPFLSILSIQTALIMAETYIWFISGLLPKILFNGEACLDGSNL